MLLVMGFCLIVCSIVGLFVLGMVAKNELLDCYEEIERLEEENQKMKTGIKITLRGY